MTALPAEITEGITAALAPLGETVYATESRYPFKYAYDFLRKHAAEFNATLPVDDRLVDTRSDAVQWLVLTLDVADSRDSRYRRACEALADAYLTENGLTRDPALMDSARAVERRAESARDAILPADRDAVLGRNHIVLNVGHGEFKGRVTSACHDYATIRPEGSLSGVDLRVEFRDVVHARRVDAFA